LEASLDEGKEELTEMSVSDKLEGFRKEQKVRFSSHYSFISRPVRSPPLLSLSSFLLQDFIGLSFETIAGSGPNGAIIHYRADSESNRKVTKKEMFLLDSGAQYLDGTTGSYCRFLVFVSG
jgi:Xaa-Pro aminopeptidase